MSGNSDESDHDGDDNAVRPGDVEWENRRLCGDGTCIGVLDTDGRCKVCGRFSAENQEDDGPPSVMGENERQGTAVPENRDQDDPTSPDGDPDWENRVLCSDGNCIGVIGAEGACKVCGKPLESTTTGLSANLAGRPL